MTRDGTPEMMAGNEASGPDRVSIEGTEHFTTAKNFGEERELAPVVYQTKEPPGVIVVVIEELIVDWLFVLARKPEGDRVPDVVHDPGDMARTSSRSASVSTACCRCRCHSPHRTG